MREVRGRAFSERIASRLSDDQWRYAVAQALEADGGWFPTIDELIGWGLEMPKAPGAEPLRLEAGGGAVVTNEQGMAIFRAELEKLGVKDPTLPPIEAIVDAADKEGE